VETDGFDQAALLQFGSGWEFGNVKFPSIIVELQSRQQDMVEALQILSVALGRHFDFSLTLGPSQLRRK
jgi:type IV secretory pathway VirJ component